MGVPLGTLVRVGWFGRCFGQRIILTTAYRKASGPVVLDSVAEMNLLIDDLIVGGGVDVLTPYMKCLPSDYNLEEIRAQIVSPTREAYVGRVLSTPGVHPSPATVANDSACITLKGVLAGSWNRSNKHIGPVPDDVSASGLLKPAYITRLADLANHLTFPAVIGAGQDYRPVVINGPAHPGSGDLVSYSIGVQSRVQRRRTVGLGE